MSKRNALGEINFDFEESINTINGIPITPSDPIETTVNEPKKEEKKEKTQKKESIIDNILDANKIKKLQEKEKKITKKEQNRDDLEELKEKVLNEIRKDEKSIYEEQQEKEEKKKDNKPSTKKHLKEGYTRHTFAIKDEQLELIRALAEYKGLEQKQLLETLLNKAFESIEDKTKEKALKYLHSEKNKDIDIFS